VSPTVIGADVAEQRSLAVSTGEGAPVLDVAGVDFVREGREILAGIDLTVHAGEHWALLGSNGAGKSTLLSLCGAVRHPTHGSVEVLGYRLGRVDMRELRGWIGHVDPRQPLDERMSVEQAVLTGATGTNGPDPALEADRRGAAPGRTSCSSCSHGGPAQRRADHPLAGRARPHPGGQGPDAEAAPAAARRAEHRTGPWPPGSGCSPRSTPCAPSTPGWPACWSRTTWRSCRPARRTRCCSPAAARLAAGAGRPGVDQRERQCVLRPPGADHPVAAGAGARRPSRSATPNCPTGRPTAGPDRSSAARPARARPTADTTRPRPGRAGPTARRVRALSGRRG